MATDLTRYLEFAFNDLKTASIQNELDIITTKQNTQYSHESDNESKSFEDKTNILINYVSKKSGLTNREVIRRSQRKRKALGPVTLWLCVSLLAREQGLDMDKINQILENRFLKSSIFFSFKI